MAAEAADWRSNLGSLDEAVAARVTAFVDSAGADGARIVDQWLAAEADRRLLIEVFASREEASSCTPAALRLMLLAAREAGSAKGTHSLMHRLASGPASGAAFDIEALAAEITPIAESERHPDEILQPTLRWILDERVPLSSLPALGGMTRLAAASCRMEHARQDFADEAAHDMGSGPLVGSGAWQDAAGAQAPSSADPLGGLLAAMRESHVDELVEACGAGLPPAEHQLALRLALRLAGDRDPRLDAARRARLAAALRPRAAASPARDWTALKLWVRLDRSAAQDELLHGLAGSSAPDRDLLQTLLSESPASGERDAWVSVLSRLNRTALERGTVLSDALSAWVAQDRDGAARYLTQELEIAALPQGPLAVVTGMLVALGGPGAIERLRLIAGRTDPAGQRARMALEILGASPPLEIERLCAEWRRTGTSEALAALYNEVIDSLPAGTSFGPWRDRLGAPASEIGGSLWYHSVDGGHRLYLEVDKQDRLRAWSLR